MAIVTEVLATLRIASGQTASQALSDVISKLVASAGLGSSVQLTVHVPDTLTGTVVTEVSDTFPGSAWKDLTDYAGNAIVLTAGEAVGIPYTGFKDLRFVSGSAEGANRDFVVMTKVETE